ncbi:MAG: hypothetical protein RL499_382 [Actinomycetota bacterium]|jgi:hypothetical protein
MAKDELKLPGDDEKKPEVSMNRLALWIIVGAVGAYLLISGVLGIISNG